MENLLIFITTAGALILFLSVTGLVIILRQRRSSQHSKEKGEKAKKPRTSYVKTPQLGFILPTHVPKTVSYVNSNALRSSSQEFSPDTIDPELYHATKNEPSEYSPSPPGSLCFSVHYEKETEKLIVGVVRGQRLRRPKSSNPMATPYVKICLLPDKRKKLQTKARQKTSNPLFNEEFYFYCPFSELRQRCLRFTVCDFDRFSRQNVIGTVMFSLNHNFESILRDEGCVEVWRDIEDYETEPCNCFGEVLFSLQYLPTAKRLTIAILKGKGFGIQGNGKDPSIYVKITMICGGKASRSRKTVKKHDMDPVFNESFHFNVSDTLFDRTSFTLAVVNHKRLMGRVVVGPFLYATGSGLTHWNDMLDSPHKAVAMWHTLF